jgi:hypothetical protein
MRHGSLLVGTVAAGAIFCCGGCWPTDAPSKSDGGAVAYAAPTLQLTVSGVHFGPTAPDPGSYVDLVVSRDATGMPNGASFRLQASIGTAGCGLAFDRFGPGTTIGVGQYTVQSMQGAFTLDGTVYPTTSERIATPEGGAGCTGTDCDNAAFVLSAVDAQHASGYFRGTVTADSGAGVADVVCSFWIPMRTYTP